MGRNPPPPPPVRSLHSCTAGRPRGSCTCQAACSQGHAVKKANILTTWGGGDVGSKRTAAQANRTGAGAQPGPSSVPRPGLQRRAGVGLALQPARLPAAHSAGVGRTADAGNDGGKAVKPSVEPRKVPRTTQPTASSSQPRPDSGPSITCSALRPRFVDAQGLKRAALATAERPAAAGGASSSAAARSQSVPPAQRRLGVESTAMKHRSKSVVKPRTAKTPAPVKRRARWAAAMHSTAGGRPAARSMLLRQQGAKAGATLPPHHTLRPLHHTTPITPAQLPAAHHLRRLPARPCLQPCATRGPDGGAQPPHQRSHAQQNAAGEGGGGAGAPAAPAGGGLATAAVAAHRRGTCDCLGLGCMARLDVG